MVIVGAMTVRTRGMWKAARKPCSSKASTDSGCPVAVPSMVRGRMKMNDTRKVTESAQKTRAKGCWLPRNPWPGERAWMMAKAPAPSGMVP